MNNYIEIKRDIQDVATDLLSVVTPKEHDYTHQPSEESIIYEINNAIEQLTLIRNNI